MTLELDETKWHGCKYYIIKPFNTYTWDEMTTWCNDTFGPAGDPWINEACRWYVNNETYFFRNDGDRVLLMLRWG